MDMSQYSRLSEVDRLKRENAKLKKCLYAIRKNIDILAYVFSALSEHPPNASKAMESFEEMEHDYKIAIWSLSPSAGGCLETWARHAIKEGSLNNSYDVFNRCLDKT